MEYVFEGRTDKEFEDLIAQLEAEGKPEDAKRVRYLFEMWKRRRPEPDTRAEG